MKNIYAFTEIAYKTYPGFISINERADGIVEFTVRSPENNGMSIGSIQLTSDQLNSLTECLKNFVWTSNCEKLRLEPYTDTSG